MLQLEVPSNPHDLSAEKRSRPVAEVVDDRGHKLYRVGSLQLHK